MQPLAGTTVADLTRYLPGPFASRELQRLGARVVKIEPPDGDPTRHATPGVYEALNAGKEIVVVGRTQPSRLLRCSRRPTSCSKGSGRASGNVSGSSCPSHDPLLDHRFGVTGPRTRQAGHDLNYLGYAGALADTAPRCRPSRSPISRPAPRRR